MSKLSFEVTGMHCASCAAAVERAVKKLPGASDVYVNFAANRLTLEAAPELTPEQVADAVRKAGFGAEPGSGAPGSDCRAGRGGRSPPGDLPLHGGDRLCGAAELCRNV